MRKILTVVMVLVFAFFLFQTTPAKAVSEIDQESTGNTFAFSIISTPGTLTYQTFKPSKNTLNKVSIAIASTPVPTGLIGFTISKWNGTGWDIVKRSAMNPIQIGWNNYEFEDTVVVPESRYAIAINVLTDGDHPRWICADGSPYSRGYAVVESVDKPTWDAGFKTYGYNNSAIPTETTTGDSTASNPSTSKQSSTSTGSVNSNNADSANPSSAATTSASTSSEPAETDWLTAGLLCAATILVGVFLLLEIARRRKEKKAKITQK